MDQQELILAGALGGASVGAAGVLASTLIANRASRRRWIEDRRERDHQRIQDAGVDYIRSVEAYLASLQAAPFSRRAPGLVERIVDRVLGESVNVLVLVVQRLLYGYRWERLLDAAVAASARLRVVAPAPLRAAMDEVQAFVASDLDLTSEAATEKWRDVRERFVRVLQSQESDIA